MQQLNLLNCLPEITLMEELLRRDEELIQIRQGRKEEGGEKH